MTRNVQLALALIVFVPLSVAASDTDKKHEAAEKKAVESANSWLPLVDQEKYGDAWESAAGYLKSAVTKEDFIKAFTGVRKPLGTMKSRKIKSKEYRTSLPGAPEGEYVVIQFDTSFENKTSAIETITPMLDKDGTWKVSGYFIK